MNLHVFHIHNNCANQSWRLFIRQFVFYTVTCIVCMVSAGAAAHQYDSSFYEELARMNVRDIYERALKESKNANFDSAIAYYTVVVNRYKDNMNDSDKMMMSESLCNLGAMTYFHQQDYNQAFRYLLKGLEVACDVEYEAIKPYIYSNLSSIHSIFGDSMMSDRLCRKAFWMSKDLGDNYAYKNALLDLIFSQVHYGNFDAIKKELDDFGHHGLPEGTLWRDYTYNIYFGVKSYSLGHYDKSLSYFNKASLEIKNTLFDDIYRMIPDMMAAKALSVLGRYDEAIAKLKYYTTDGVYNNLRNYTFRALSEFYAKKGNADSAKVYKMKSLLINDSLLDYNEYMSLRDVERKYLPADVIGNRPLLSFTSGFGRVTSVMVTIVIFITAGALVYRRLRRRRHDMKESHEVAATDSQTCREQAAATPDERTLELARMIKQYLETSDDIYSLDFSLDRLAAGVGAHTRTVSRAVNEVFGVNFSTLLSQYRIKEACRRLSSPDYANVTIQAIATGVGFKSRSNFITVFRRQTGFAPNEYQKEKFAKKNMA